MLISRLHAAAGALFPPKGEEKKSEVEAERHQGKRLAPRLVCAVRYRTSLQGIDRRSVPLANRLAPEGGAPVPTNYNVTVLPSSNPSPATISPITAGGTAESVVITITARAPSPP
jgi:hypothetical protein